MVTSMLTYASYVIFITARESDDYINLTSVTWQMTINLQIELRFCLLVRVP